MTDKDHKRRGEDCSILEAGRRLGLSEQAVGIWARKAGAPLARHGRQILLKWPEFPRWREEEIKTALKKAAAPTSLDEAKERRAAAEAELAELDLAVRRGELVATAERDRQVADAFARVRGKLLTLPQAVALRVTAGTFPARVEQARAVVDDVLRELSEATDVEES